MKISLLLSVLFLGGCATLTRGSMEVLVIESDPANASVRIVPGDKICITPCSIPLRRSYMHIVHIQKDGYESVTIDVRPQTGNAGAAGMAGNLIFGGLIGAAVDATTGATKQLMPNPIRIKLPPLTTPAVQPAPQP